MGKIILAFLILSLSDFGIGTGEYKSSLSNENGETYFKNSLGLKNILLEYETGVNTEYKNMKIVLKNSHLIELNEKLYYTLNYEGEYNYDLTENKSDLFKVQGVLKLAKYINDNFFINSFFDASFCDYIYISGFENIYINPKIQFRFPQSDLDINIGGGFRHFTEESRNDYELELSANKELLSKIYIEIGDYLLKTDNVKQNIMKIEYPDIYNENLNKVYFYLSYDILKSEQFLLKAYTKGESIFYFQGGDYENEIYVGTNIQKEINGIIDLIDIYGEYGYNYKDYALSLSLKKHF